MNVTRIPRPLGLTNMIRAYHLDPTEENKQAINEAVVKSYINNGFTWNYRKRSVDELSILTGIPVPTLLMNITRVTRTLASLAKPEQLQNTIQSLMGLIIQNGMDDRGEVEEQLQKLKAAQGDSYAPFISKEVNGALKLRMDSNKQLMDILGLLKPQQGTLIQINNNPETKPEIEEGEAITTEKAVLMISSNTIPLKDDKKQLDHIFEAELIDDTPEVNAKKQKGNFSDKEGLGLKKLTSGEHIDEIMQVNHEDRRAEEYDIDLDEDEF